MSNAQYEKKKASAGTLTFSHACNVVSDDTVVSSALDTAVVNSPDTNIKNTILHEYYNKKRTTSQSE